MREKPSAEVNSVMMRPEPDCWLETSASTVGVESALSLNTLALRMKRRKTVSVTPAMGASTVAGATGTLPIWKDAGTRAPWGMVCSIGLSQCFFNEPPYFFSEPLYPGSWVDERKPPRWRRLRRFRLAAILLGCGLRLGILAAEALDTACGIHQLLLAGEERVAAGA